MKVLRILLLLGGLSVASALPPEGYTLVWSDEFEGNSLNTNNWLNEPGPGDPWAPYTSTYYTDGENIAFENGSTVLWAKREKYNGTPYTSCRITSQGKQAFQYGYIEVRLKAPEGLGLWPVLYTLGVDSIWPSCGEIIIFQTLTGPDGYHELGDSAFLGSIFWSESGGATGHETYNVKNNEKLSLSYHNFAIEWDEQMISWYFDDSLYASFDITASHLAEFHQKHYFITRLHIGGDYQGHNIDTTIFPQAMYIDYVRVHQKTTRVIEPYQKNIFNNMILENPTGAYLKVYDMRGRLIADYTEKILELKSGESVMKAIQLNLPMGVYVVRISNGINVISEKLVVQK